MSRMRWKRRNRGFTLAEVAVTLAILGIILALAIPNLMKMIMVGNEAAAMEAMRTVVDACNSFRMQGTVGGVGTMPLSLRALTAADPPYLSSRFAGGVAGTVRGYRWAYTVGPERLQQVGSKSFRFRDRFALQADPLARGFTGQRSFYTDQTGVIRSNLSGPAGPNDPVVESR